MSERGVGHLGRGAALVAATYIYFLIFAEFAFVELARRAAGDGAGLRLVMGALGLGGVAGGVLAACGPRDENWGARLGGWLLWCAAAACASLVAGAWGASGPALAGAGVGVALGGATVTLASGLRALVSRRRLGLVAGAGTGAAYACCNLPWVFAARPEAQTLLAVCAAVGGAVLAWSVKGGAEEEPGRVAKGAWTLVFLALVWMDSAAFYIIQHTEPLKDATWSGPWTLGGNAVMHLVAALFAGWLLDRGRAGFVVLAAGGSLAVACRWISWPGAALPYVAGVSLYSVALVYVPARAGRRAVAALIYAVAGWLGSALGIGMAQDLHGVPGWFAPAALCVVVAGLAWRRKTAGAAAIALAGLGLASAPEARADEAAIARGREVYIAEGCIHCHSQYVRPGMEDVVRWGPARPVEELLREKPPLFGNRRQGPDLLNVGNRRTPEWNRLHLTEPRAVSPGSRMPSYARLFAEGETSGEDLVAYLESLGAKTREARAAQVAAWRPAPEARADAALGRAWFARSCAQCHGSEGKGDGALAGRLSSRPADLSRSVLSDELEMARVIKFGRAGTPMAGHEALGDDAVVSLARHVRGLQVSEATSR